MMQKRWTLCALTTITLNGCAHTGMPATNPSDTIVTTGSRLTRWDSPRSYGVRVIHLERIRQTGEVNLSLALRKIVASIH